jgi:hypothetical protein
MVVLPDLNFSPPEEKGNNPEGEDNISGENHIEIDMLQSSKTNTAPRPHRPQITPRTSAQVHGQTETKSVISHCKCYDNSFVAVYSLC